MPIGGYFSFPELPSHPVDLVVDALLGHAQKQDVLEQMLAAVTWANQNKAPVVALDPDSSPRDLGRYLKRLWGVGWGELCSCPVQGGFHSVHSLAAKVTPPDVVSSAIERDWGTKQCQSIRIVVGNRSSIRVASLTYSPNTHSSTVECTPCTRKKCFVVALHVSLCCVTCGSTTRDKMLFRGCVTRHFVVLCVTVPPVTKNDISWLRYAWRYQPWCDRWLSWCLVVDLPRRRSGQMVHRTGAAPGKTRRFTLIRAACSVFCLWCSTSVFRAQKVHSPNLLKRKCTSKVVRICSIITFYLSKLWKAKFSLLCDVIFLVGLEGKFDIDHSQEWKG